MLFLAERPWSCRIEHGGGSDVAATTVGVFPTKNLPGQPCCTCNTGTNENNVDDKVMSLFKHSNVTSEDFGPVVKLHHKKTLSQVHLYFVSFITGCILNSNWKIRCDF